MMTVDLPWNHKYQNEIRDGTAAVHTREGLLTLFHTLEDTGMGKRNYVMGAILFCLQPPFHIR